MRKKRLLLHLFLVAVSVLALMPFAWMVSSSFMTRADVLARRLLPQALHWATYAEAWRDAQFGLYFKNSLILSSLQVLGICTTGSLAAYSLARLSFPGKNLLFLLILSTLMIPQSVTLVPNVLIVTWLDQHTPIPWINNWPALTVPFMCNAFAIFLLRQFFAVIPWDFWDAARVDGAGHLRFLLQIVVPMSKAPLVTIAMLSFMGAWNALAWPLLVTNTPDWRPLSVGLLNLVEEAGVELQLQMAGATISILPILIVYAFIQRQFTESIMQSGIKG